MIAPIPVGETLESWTPIVRLQKSPVFPPMYQPGTHYEGDKISATQSYHAHGYTFEVAAMHARSAVATARAIYREHVGEDHVVPDAKG